MDTCHRYCTVVGPDLQTRGGLVIPAIRGGGLQKKKVLPSGPRFGLKIRGEAQAPPQDLQLLYETDMRGEG